MVPIIHTNINFNVNAARIINEQPFYNGSLERHIKVFGAENERKRPEHEGTMWEQVHFLKSREELMHIS